MHAIMYGMLENCSRVVLLVVMMLVILLNPLCRRSIK